MHLLGCLLGLVLGLLLIALNVGLRLWWNIRKFFGGNTNGMNDFGGMNGTYGSRNQGNTQDNNQNTGSQNTSNPNTSHDKVFADNEGDYVDFEEVK